jgi:predicted ATPase
VVEVLRGLREQRPFTLTQPWLAELSQLLPELRDGVGELALRTRDEIAGRADLFEAVAHAIAALADAEPLVILVDDLQWADAASLELLQFAARRWAERRARILLLLTVRLEAVLGSPSLAGWLLDLGRETPLERIDLHPLGAAETLQLVKGLDADAPARFGEWLFTTTRGHPFYVVETLKDLLERGEIRARHGTDGAWSLDVGGARRDAPLMPLAVREVIHARLARLSPAATTLLTAGAVLGQRFDFESLCRVADLGESLGLAALDELLTARLVLETGEGVDYDFAHDKIREAVYDLASRARRQVFHRRALDASRATASPATLAHHALEAGSTEQAARFNQAAGDAAMRVFAVADAIQHYERARQLAGGAEPEPELVLKLGRAYEMNAEAQKARALYERLVERRDLPPATQIIALSRLAVVTAQAFELARTFQLLQRALVAAQQAGDADARAETEWSLAFSSYYAADFDTALIYGEGALQRARDLERPELIARSLNVLAYIQSARGEQGAAIALARESQALYARLGDRAMELDSLVHLGNAELRYGDTEAGLVTVRAALEASRQFENRWGEVAALIQLALGLPAAGEVDEAIECARRAVQLARAHEMTLLLPLANVALAASYRAASRLDEAGALLRQVLANGVTDEAARCVQAELAATTALAGDWHAAGRYARDALEGRLHPLMLVERAVWLEVEVLVRTGATQQAGELLRRYGQRVGDSPRHRRAYEWARARLQALTSSSDT